MTKTELDALLKELEEQAVEQAQYHADSMSNKTEAVMYRAAAALRELEKSAGRWDAFIGCARIRVIGTAGPTETGYAHIGLEAWTHHGAESLESARVRLTEFADACVALKEPQ